MKKPLVAAFACAFTAMVIGMGCGDSSDGKPAPWGRSSGGPSEPEQTLEGDPDAGPPPTSTPTCAEHPKVDDRPACDSCVRESCCEYVLACSDSPDCDAVMQCLDECEADDLTCPITCRVLHESGAALLNQVGSCAQTRCKTECPMSLPDAGDFADVF